MNNSISGVSIPKSPKSPVKTHIYVTRSVFRQWCNDCQDYTIHGFQEGGTWELYQCLICGAWKEYRVR